MASPEMEHAAQPETVVEEHRFPPKTYSATRIDDVRERIRYPGSGDVDRLLPPDFWGEMANNT